MAKEDPEFAAGLALLQKPVLPLAGMAQFLYLTGDFAAFADLLAELPEPIETGGIVYAHPASDLLPYMESMQALVQVRWGQAPGIRVLDAAGEALDDLSAAIAFSNQEILSHELERINSLLCGPCDCQLCCIGPDAAMRQHYFEIPLQSGECALFPCARVDTTGSRKARPEDEPGLSLDGRIFYEHSEPLLVHWQDGPSLILPRQTLCPNLAENGGCRIYDQRPLVCRRPQIFPYLLEPGQRNESDAMPTFRLRQALLAVMDCPYVARLRGEIAAYAAVCELELVFRHNKA